MKTAKWLDLEEDRPIGAPPRNRRLWAPLDSPPVPETLSRTVWNSNPKCRLCSGAGIRTHFRYQSGLRRQSSKRTRVAEPVDETAEKQAVPRVRSGAGVEPTQRGTATPHRF
jgi:hypothetical protein